MKDFEDCSLEETGKGKEISYIINNYKSTIISKS